MPASGGASDKFGNAYEGLWTIDCLLSVVEGASSSLLLEPLDRDESLGVEFRLTRVNGTFEYWSVKRQTTRASGWTLSILNTKDENGRSILADLLSHVSKHPANQAVFTSMLAASELDELRSFAVDPDTFINRLDRARKPLKQAFNAQILPLCAGDVSRACELLRRIRTHAIDDEQLTQRVDFAVRKLFYHTENIAIDPAAVRGLLADFLLKRIHKPIDREAILEFLSAHSIRLRDWAADHTLRNRLNELRDAYIGPLRQQLINGVEIALNTSTPVFDTGHKLVVSRLIVAAPAGGGKSISIAGIVEQLSKSQIPVLPLRFDHLPDGTLSTAELGRKLDLPESPVVTLAGVANGGSCALIIDQLDAISLASGRHVELWTIFDALRREAAEHPNMAVIVGCREFDLSHDWRIQQLIQPPNNYSVIRLQKLTTAQLDEILKSRAIDPQTVDVKLKEVLSLPLHASMFISMSHSDRMGVATRDGLFDRFWVIKEQNTSRRLGRKAEWTGVIDRLVGWLSDNQQLSAPSFVLDDFAPDVAAMVSENFLVLDHAAYRFVHETFFDYAFARRFIFRGGRLIELLTTSEQHLFRRAQVRQVLSFLRDKQFDRFLEELRTILFDDRVRFHIKSQLFRWLSSLQKPSIEEWKILLAWCGEDPGHRRHVQVLLAGRSGWFDVLDSVGFFDSALASGDERRMNEAIWLFTIRNTLDTRFARITELLKKHRRTTEHWPDYLRAVFRTGHVYQGREIFDYFLQLVDDGTLDELHPGFAVNDTWWSIVYSINEHRPDFAAETVAHWIDRQVALWDGKEGGTLRQQFERSGQGEHVLHEMISKDAANVARNILPRIANLVSRLAESRDDRLDVDPLWSFRSFTDGFLTITSSILEATAQSLEVSAKNDPVQFHALISPYLSSQHDALVYLLLRGMTAAPALCAEQLARYLATDARRLLVGYTFTSGNGGSASYYTSIQAIKACSTTCSPEAYEALETAILSLQPRWEISDPARRGRTQLEILEAIDQLRLGGKARSRLDELRRKFPSFSPKPPQRVAMRMATTPIPSAAFEKMSDSDWIGAMEKYAGDIGFDRLTKGGERELGRVLRSEASKDPKRFGVLLESMPATLPSTYFQDILFGIAEPPLQEGRVSDIGTPELARLVRCVHDLPNHPCGSSISYLMYRTGGSWPSDIRIILSWYAQYDPDPKIEPSPEKAQSGQPYGSRLIDAGINSVRGAMAGAIARLLFDDPSAFPDFRDAITALAQDASLPVRSCAVEPLLAMFNVDESLAVDLFLHLVGADDELLATNRVESFLHHSIFRNYSKLKPTLERMLRSGHESVVAAAARQICLGIIEGAVPEADLQQIVRGTEVMRQAASEVYAANIAHPGIGLKCRTALKPFFADPSQAIRDAAATAFHNWKNLDADGKEDLLSGFLTAGIAATSFHPIVHAIETNPIQLPDLVCDLAERCVKVFNSEAGDIRTHTAMVAGDLAKIVIRMYAQTRDARIRTRCLNLIDQMEQNFFFGLSEELEKIER